MSLLVYALIERELRQRMKEEGLEDLPLYPEMRATMRPTADLALAALLGWRRHHLLDATGSVLKTFHDPLSPGAKMVLHLLKVDLQPYLA